jgi:ring-1,2-phenylacetyl-CoA epoxidase subunit PaaD
VNETDADAAGERESMVWAALARVEDPEIPALSLVDLGVIRFVRQQPNGSMEVGLSQTYSGCPATAVIRHSVEAALLREGLGPVTVTDLLAPAWTSDWISAVGRRKLMEYGIAPPMVAMGSARQLLHGDRPPGCPRCGSTDTECVSEFGSTACKALYRCRACLEPFEYFKCI